MILLLAFLIGVLTGLRSFTPVAATAWYTHLGWIKLRSPMSWMGSTASAVVFTVLAIVELVWDKLPKTPSRTAPPGLIARIVLGGLTGACVAMSGGGAAATGAGLGVIGGIAGAFGGYQARTRLVKALHAPDYVVAVLEDLVTICGSLWVLSRI
ncbi:MAG TPA: DUF4126 family protein [Candidatus Limnocylindrales bacterium]|nr:DUF4126 family protein [Candidatus Limnocylindrales bacterium]